MRAQAADPVQTLLLLPIEHSDAGERAWVDDTIAWLKDVPQGERGGRLRALAERIEQNAAVTQRFQQLWKKAYAPRLFAEAALPEATSLLRELMVRIKRRFLPQFDDELDLYSALQKADLHQADAEWVSSLSDKDVGPWRALLGQSSSSDMRVAIHLLAIRASATALSRSVMSVMPHQYETDSPFFDLAGEARDFPSTNSEPLRNVIQQCRISAGLAHARMEERGVSADLVFRLDLVIGQLVRMEELLNVIEQKRDGRAFAAVLLRALASETGLDNLLRNSVNRVARRVVVHTGKSGEHYIAGSASEWKSMGYGAVGAGVITAFTALFKYLFGATQMAPLWIGIAHSLNYTLSFVLMQLLGWSLASKMPSMTAAALCDALEKEDGMQSEVKLVAAITRTQTVVTLGNLVGAIPVALLIDLLIRFTTGKPFLSEEQAAHGVASLHPLLSFTLPFAALTGGFLWFSSLFAGWTSNWMAVNRLPAAVAQSRKVRNVLGAGTAVWLAAFIKDQLSGVAGYVALGLMLGLLPFVSVFAGFPIEVRHITLASASLGYDVSALAWEGALSWLDLGWALIGLAAVGVLNFGVSFALGLWLAVRARNLDTQSRRRLISVLGKEFRRNPSKFLWSHDLELTPAAVNYETH